MADIFGIDLGTTYSAVATINSNGYPKVIMDNNAASETLPSAVYYPEGDSSDVVIGAAAKEAAYEHPDRVFQFFKRWMARTNDKDYVPMLLDGRELTPIELSAWVLKKICKYAKDGGYPIEEAVITVPAYFSIEQREATKEAGKAAGINVLATINEPTAAALSYCFGKLSENRTVLVYDLGGGTFDVTLVTMAVNSDGSMRADVVCTDGSDMLGGKDWDEIMGEILKEKFIEATGVSEVEPEVANELRQLAETVKQKLTDTDSYTTKYKVDGDRLRLTVTRAEFDARTRHLLDQTINKINSVLAKANELGYTEDMVDLVLQVGGSTRMGQVRDCLNDRFGSKVQFYEPDKAVAMGAAIACKYLADGRDVDYMNQQFKKLDLSGKVTVTKTQTGDFEVKDRTGHTTVIEQEKIGESMIEKLEEASATGTMNGDELTEVVEKTGLGISIGDVAPSTFGVVIKRGGQYFCRNHVMIGASTPCEGIQQYGVPGGDRIHLILPVVQSISQNEEDPVLRPDPAKTVYEFPDPALQMKQVAMLELETVPGLRPGEPVDVSVNFDRLANLAVTMTILSTGETTQQTVNFNVASAEDLAKIREATDTMNIVDDID